MTALQGGQSVDQLRSTVAHSDQAKAAVNAFYQQLFGIDADPTALKNCQDALAAGQSLHDQQAFLRPRFAHSAAEAGAISDAFRQVLGHGADAGSSGVAHYEDQIAGGKSLGDVRGQIASSQEATDDITGLYRTVLGRPPSVDEFKASRASLGSGRSLAQLRASLAKSPDAQALINSFFQATAGRPATGDEMARAQQTLGTLNPNGVQGPLSFNATVNSMEVSVVATDTNATITGVDPNSGVPFSMNVAPNAPPSYTPQNTLQQDASALGTLGSAAMAGYRALKALAADTPTGAMTELSISLAFATLSALGKYDDISKTVQDIQNALTPDLNKNLEMIALTNPGSFGPQLGAGLPPSDFGDPHPPAQDPSPAYAGNAPASASGTVGDNPGGAAAA